MTIASNTSQSHAGDGEKCEVSLHPECLNRHCTRSYPCQKPMVNNNLQIHFAFYPIDTKFLIEAAYSGVCYLVYLSHCRFVLGLWVLGLLHVSANADTREPFDLSDASIGQWPGESIALDVPLPPSLKILPAFSEADTFDFARRSDESWLQYNLRRIDGVPLGPYGADTFFDQSSNVGWEIAAAFGGVTVLGLKSWDWGSSSFKFNSEGWFGKNTGSSGIDKLGHAYTTYMLTEYFTQRIAHTSEDPRGAAVTGAIIAMGVQTYVEVFDGFSGDHGFSYEDMVFNASGAAFSVARSTFPELASKLDYRLIYWPSGKVNGFHPITDYSGQKYVLALKLSGFEAFEDTPLRFLELHGGYYATGISKAEKRAGVERGRHLYAGIGINFTELLQALPGNDSALSLGVQNFTRYVQPPYSYLGTSY
jgi:hypothetical protein